MIRRCSCGAVLGETINGYYISTRGGKYIRTDGNVEVHCKGCDKRYLFIRSKNGSFTITILNNISFPGLNNKEKKIAKIMQEREAVEGPL